MASALNLSLLARGVGEVKRNGHEKIDVKLEPGDYHNYVGSQQKLYLPQINPTYSDALPSDTKRVSLPKTFITRKGALLLFSEDFAHKTKDTDLRVQQNKKAENENLEELDLQTVDDLARSILSYGGSHHGSEINLHFVKEGRIPKRVRPGFSARRYLSKLTRSFDETFLTNLLNKGYVSENSLFQTNTLVPNLRKRINDDLSYMPAPYRIMRQMLLAPGMLSGYSFYRQQTDGTQSDLSVLTEEKEEDLSEGHPQHRQQGQGHQQIHGQGQEQGELKIVEIKDGVARPVVYNDLPQEDKENVLADLLVKSAISHALEKQKQIFEERVRSDRGSAAGEEFGLVISGQQSQTSGQDVNVAQFDMGDAVRSYIESQLSGQDEIQQTSRAQLPQITSIRTLQENSVVLPPISNANALQRQVQTSPYHRKHSPGGASSTRSRHDQSGEKEDVLSSRLQVLPPIQPGMKLVEVHLDDGTVQHAVVGEDGTPMFSVEPPTPQRSTLIDEAAHHAAHVGEGRDSVRGSESGSIRDQKLKAAQSHHGSQQSLFSAASSARSAGPVFGAGSILDSTVEVGRQEEQTHVAGPQMPKFRGKALKTGGSKVKDKKDQLSSESGVSRGSRVVLPGGQVLSVGGSMGIQQEANLMSQDHRSDGDTSTPDYGSETSWPGQSQAHKSQCQSHKSSRSAQSDHSSKSSKTLIAKEHPTESTIINQDVENEGGLDDAITTWAYVAPSSPVELHNVTVECSQQVSLLEQDKLIGSMRSREKLRGTTEPVEESVGVSAVENTNGAEENKISITTLNVHDESAIIDIVGAVNTPREVHDVGCETVIRSETSSPDDHPGSHRSMYTGHVIQAITPCNMASAEPLTPRPSTSIRPSAKLMPQKVDKLKLNQETEHRDGAEDNKTVRSPGGGSMGVSMGIRINVSDKSHIGNPKQSIKDDYAYYDEKISSVEVDDYSSRVGHLPTSPGEINQKISVNDSKPQNTLTSFEKNKPMKKSRDVSQLRPLSAVSGVSIRLSRSRQYGDEDVYSKPVSGVYTVDGVPYDVEYPPSRPSTSQHSHTTLKHSRYGDMMMSQPSSPIATQRSRSIASSGGISIYNTTRLTIPPLETGRRGYDTDSVDTSQDMSEQELVQHLSDQAHRIAAAILSRPGTGLDLIQDAQRVSHIHSGPASVVNEYKALLKETINTALTQSQGEDAQLLPDDADIDEEVVMAIAHQDNITADDLEIVETDQGQQVVRIKSSRKDAIKQSSERPDKPKSLRSGQSGTSTSKKSLLAPSHSPSRGALSRSDEEHHSERGRSHRSRLQPSAASSGVTSSKSGITLPSQLASEEENVNSSSRFTATHKSKSEQNPLSAKSCKSQYNRKTSNSEVNKTIPKLMDPPEQKTIKTIVKTCVSDEPVIEGGRSAGDLKSHKIESKSGVSLSGESDGSGTKLDRTQSKSKITKEETKEEFVVGVVHDNTQIQRLYGPIEQPAKKSKDSKKPRVPPAKSPKKKKSKSKERKESRTSGSDKEGGSPTRERKKKLHKKKSSRPDSQLSVSRVASEAGSTHTESEKPQDEEEQEEMDFIIIRDEFSPSEDEQQPETKSVKSVKSKKSKKSITPIDPLSDTESGLKHRRPDPEPDTSLHTVSSKDARAAERAARANKRREEVDNKRREREEQQRRQKDEMDERERMQRQLEEDRRQKEEERRMKREQEEEERRKQEQAEAERERRARLEAEREKKVKEEYARKLELLKQQKLEEEKKRKELEEQRLREEEERKREEEAMMAEMAEEERLEYQRRKAEEEEQRRIELELQKRKEAEEMLRLEVEARLMAEEMARRQAEMELRLNFNRDLHLEAYGMEHCHNITEAFTWSYFELLQWLGLDRPDFERMRFEPHHM